MKKIVFALVSSLLTLFLIWVIMFQFTVDDLSNITDYHLDLYTMLDRFNFNSSFEENFSYIFRSFIDSIKQISSSGVATKLFETAGYDSIGTWLLTNVLDAGLNPLYLIVYPIVVLGYLQVLILNFLGVSTIVATAIFDFIFNPVFIANDTIVIPPIVVIPEWPIL